MNTPENNNWLDEALSTAFGSNKSNPDFDKWRKAHPQAIERLTSQAGRNSSPAKRPLNLRNIIMKSKLTKLAAAAAIIVVATLGIVLLDKSATPAWAIGQTVEALKNIKSATATGKCTLHNKTFNVKLFVKADSNKPYSFNGRGESDQLICVIRDNIVYEYEIGCGEIYSYNLENTEGKSFVSKLWYDVMKNVPWIAPIAPTILEAAKLVASDWEEIYKKDNQTGRNCVFVTGSYKPLSTSFMMVFDLETKLIVRAQYWTNSNREGEPALKTDNIVYNTEITDDLFDLEKTTGAQVVSMEEMEKRFILWRKGIDLHDNKQYLEAIKIYQQIYDEYPQFIKTPEVLIMIAICYRQMAQYDKAIEYFEKVHREYSAPRYAILDSYRLLGRCYITTGQDDKAREAFQKCLDLIGQWDPQGLEWGKYRELTETDMQTIYHKSNN